MIEIIGEEVLHGPVDIVVVVEDPILDQDHDLNPTKNIQDLQDPLPKERDLIQNHDQEA